MLAYHSDTKIKTKYLTRLKAHAKADEIIQGTYWENGKGCAVGCTIEGSQQGGSYHKAMEKQLGIPEALCYLEDRIFEGLKNGDAKEFPVKFLAAIKPGADLSLVVPKFIVWMLGDLEKFVQKEPQGTKPLKDVRALYQRIIDGGKVKKSEWEKVHAAAAAASAAYAYASASAAAYASAAADSDSAAYAYASAAAYAYASASAYAYASRAKHYKTMAKKLIELLKAAPVLS